MRIQSCMRIFQYACTPVCVRWGPRAVLHANMEVRIQPGGAHNHGYLRPLRSACSPTCGRASAHTVCMRTFTYLTGSVQKHISDVDLLDLRGAHTGTLILYAHLNLRANVRIQDHNMPSCMRTSFFLYAHISREFMCAYRNAI